MRIERSDGDFEVTSAGLALSMRKTSMDYMMFRILAENPTLRNANDLPRVQEMARKLFDMMRDTLTRELGHVFHRDRERGVGIWGGAVRVFTADNRVPLNLVNEYFETNRLILGMINPAIWRAVANVPIARFTGPNIDPSIRAFLQYHNEIRPIFNVQNFRTVAQINADTTLTNLQKEAQRSAINIPFLHRYFLLMRRTFTNVMNLVVHGWTVERLQTLLVTIETARYDVTFWDIELRTKRGDPVRRMRRDDVIRSLRVLINLLKQARDISQLPLVQLPDMILLSTFIVFLNNVHGLGKWQIAADNTFLTPLANAFFDHQNWGQTRIHILNMNSTEMRLSFSTFPISAPSFDRLQRLVRLFANYPGWHPLRGVLTIQRPQRPTLPVRVWFTLAVADARLSREGYRKLEYSHVLLFHKITLEQQSLPIELYRRILERFQQLIRNPNDDDDDDDDDDRPRHVIVSKKKKKKKKKIMVRQRRGPEKTLPLIIKATREGKAVSLQVLQLAFTFIKRSGKHRRALVDHVVMRLKLNIRVDQNLIRLAIQMTQLRSGPHGRLHPYIQYISSMLSVL